MVAAEALAVALVARVAPAESIAIDMAEMPSFFKNARMENAATKFIFLLILFLTLSTPKYVSDPARENSNNKITCYQVMK